jgi:multiple sugar transport system permease protein
VITGAGFRWLRRLGLAALTLFVVVPLYPIVLTAFVTPAEVQAPFHWIPAHVTLSAFRDMWSAMPLGRYLLNSLLVSSSAAVLAIVLGVPAAYGLVRFRFIGRRIVLLSLLATQTVSGLLFLLPLVLVFAELHRRTGIQLLGSYAGLILTALTFALPFSIGLLINYFASLPPELAESAYDLGAGPVSTLLLVILPNALPAIASVAVFAFSLSWGEVMFSSVLSNDSTRTLAVGLSGFANDLQPQWNELMAASILSALPVLIAFLLVQRHLVAGLAGSASRSKRLDVLDDQHGRLRP